MINWNTFPVVEGYLLSCPFVGLYATLCWLNCFASNKRISMLAGKIVIFYLMKRLEQIVQNGICKCLFEIWLMEFDHAYSFLCFLFTNIHANGFLFLWVYLHMNMDICAQLSICCLCPNCSSPVHKKTEALMQHPLQTPCWPNEEHSIRELSQPLIQCQC